MDTWSEALIQEKGSWFLEHDKITLLILPG